MVDLLFIVVVIAFFIVCVAYVRLCDRIIGPDAPERESADAGAADELEAVGS